MRKHNSRGVIAIKGSSQPNKPVINRPSAQDVNASGHTLRHGVQLWNIGVNTAKDTLFARLTGDIGRDVADRRCHFPADLPADFYEMYGAERYDALRKRWVKRPGARNESWDCAVYCYAAACHPLVRVYAKRDAEWAALEALLEPVSADLFVASAGAPIIVEPPASTRREVPSFGTTSAFKRADGDDDKESRFGSCEWRSR